ncbi:hypothetical protein BD410DRAFT_491731 [Rickenella mellea]|uniref:Uncharacterized protein n=1 Tax=Rickenella mellea TaxID=50990 RepID=A0A4Y7PTG3_9AGAM|nr:hypothetical protein BD410DRAFT_491731 [Rickenella mellea]
MKKLGLRNGLGYFILRDGALYFLAKLVIGVMLIAAFFAPPSGTLGELGIMVDGLSSPLTAILINRLVLSLRQVSRFHDGNAPTLGGMCTIPEPVFATNSFLGNVGAPLRVGPVDDDEISIDDEAEVVRGYL